MTGLKILVFARPRILNVFCLICVCVFWLLRIALVEMSFGLSCVGWMPRPVIEPGTFRSSVLRSPNRIFISDRWHSSCNDVRRCRRQSDKHTDV